MRHQQKFTPPVPSSKTPSPPTTWPALREREEVLTAAEAEMAGPWKDVPLRGKPGATAVLREWEDLDAGDRPVAVWWDEETADGYPVVVMYGELGPQVAGWLDRFEPQWIEALHLLEAIVRSPRALAALLEAAGPGAEEQVGRIRARRQRE